jgi:hypothetical protein
MIRVLSTFCVGLMGLSILTLYHISEQTRVARHDLVRAEEQVRTERTQISVLEAQWQQAASPEAIQKLAESTLGMQNATTVQLASVAQLPRRADAPLNNEQVQSASAQLGTGSVVKISAPDGM